MITHASIFPSLRRIQRATVVWLTSWWRLLQFAVLVLTLAFTPSSYRKDNRNRLACQLVLSTAPNLLWFSILATLISLVIIRIVVVTAFSYGLSGYALEMVVRVLVLELIPLTVALFVALRTTLPAGVEFAQKRLANAAAAPAGSAGARTDPVEALRTEFFPRAAAGMFAVWLLGAVSCILTLVLTYLVIYGFTPYGLPGYTRVVGQIFNPSVALILVLKIAFFSFAVGLIPLASSYFDAAANPFVLRFRATHGLADMVRMFSVILLIEIASLMGNYY
ncbi:MlaE family ABC transporter permease [Pseudoduganella chitinolytica]|uniref:ABC transporter permease n=1 Tax=Pseudoduganella chitinolytica TaxID=34070 RepID=A0ABY8BEN6_9BURK|nr:ABC transporter permease [Pseudoduganella chitinolytica]WEF33738.1 ABC transporter permease [Pseudoduganella chitinolytica]